MTKRDRILLVEDEEFVRKSMQALLVQEGFEVAAVADLASAREHSRQGLSDLVLTDLRLPDGQGAELLELDEVGRDGVPIVILTGHGTVDQAVDAMKSGAFDFLQKPIEPDQLVLVVRRALEHGRLGREVRRLREAAGRRTGGHPLVGSSTGMERVRHMIRQVAPTETTVLVSGESGTGKELVSAQVHANSKRAEGAFVVVNCAAVPEALFESEFFGHRRGAFSGAHIDREGRFAEAEGGTLVLDEVQSLGLDVQAKLLRVLESGEFQMVGESRTRRVDVRIVAATNTDLERLVTEGGFRSDLYWRLNVFPLAVPPLREHREDLPELVDDLGTRIVARLGGGSPFAIEAAALDLMQAYDWPGNVRELRNLLERAAILAPPGGSLSAAFLDDLLGKTRFTVSAVAGDLNLKKRLEVVERETILEALTRTGGSKKDAAGLLGLDPKNLSYYLRKHAVGDVPT